MMYEVDWVCANLKTCRLEAGAFGSAAQAKLSQHPCSAKVVNWAATVTPRFTAKFPGTIEDFQMYSL